MPNYYYDGSFDGLLTTIFEAYKNRKKVIRIVAETEQLTLGTDDIHIITDYFIARRVEKTICDKLSENFFEGVRLCFLSCENNKDTVIAYTVYKALDSDEKIINSVDEHAFLMNKFVKRVLRERHIYIGVLRFREMKDGALFSKIEPKNNVLPILLSHFQKRLGKEKFAVFDKKREMMAYYNSEKFELFFMKSPEVEWSNEEEEYSSLWSTFHKSISIKERKNKKLQQSNLPKYYWKYLVEEMG